ncbi:hypothetical protein RclHR1_19770002 [Rhizophagus clarus]|uniref:Uncharacterized protein n=1 Tax=Rhizophagus clarus TaxID=94130 RepID=A0A2Z6R2C9_9GLOM|nr:hypothetical protein RclHR1_19770002 [Rhizophagus clarus]GET03538.1 hypothetical protein GLOIN_2v1842544 [Rhizophagus clarus]
MRKVQNFYVKLIALFTIILFIYPLYTTAQDKRTLFHVEEKYYGPDSLPIIESLKSYDDGTVVLRVVRQIPEEPCFQDMFYLRIIYPNGLIEEKDIKLDIQKFSYCFLCPALFNFETKDCLRYELIGNDLILVIYYNNSTELNGAYEELGMVIDFDGNVKDTISFGIEVVDPASYLSLSFVELNINREKGFIKVSSKIDLTNDQNNLRWQQYRVEPNGKFTNLTNGELVTAADFNTKVVPTVDGGYAIVYTHDSHSQISAAFIGYDQEDATIFSLYQTQLNDLATSFCDFEYVGVGQSCWLTTNYSAPNFQVLKINFLSFGSVVSFETLNFSRDAIPETIVKNLPFGGFLFANSDVQGATNYSLFAEDGTLFTSYKLDQSEGIFANLVLPNNTLLISQVITNNTWGLDVIDLFKLTNKDNKYLNMHIKSTFPDLNSSIDSDVTNFSIDFYEPVELSIGNLSIYQMDDQQNSLRQLTSGIICTLDNGDKSVNVNILGSTFSKSGGNYFIKIDNNFVKDRAYREPLLGVSENIWKFTINEKNPPYDNIIDSTSGLLQLNAEGTKIFKNSLNDEMLFNPLLNELADAVQISRDRLSKNKYQIINSINSDQEQLLISINIKETKNRYEKDVNSIINDLNTAIVFKDQSPIGQGQFTQYLDSTFNFKPDPNYWDEYKFKLLGLFIALVLLVILFFLANMRERKIAKMEMEEEKKEKKGYNFAIFTLASIIFDFVMDTLFIKNNSNDIQELYVPSLLFYTLPIAINSISAFLIISRENGEKFHEWFTRNFKLASIFTVLAGADVEILNILHSNMAGFKTFRAPFSNSAKQTIFWLAVTNIFIEDIPQLFIQIEYRKRSVTYDIVPILTLVSSTIILTINIIGRSYQAISRLRDTNKTSNNDLKEKKISLI